MTVGHGKTSLLLTEQERSAKLDSLLSDRFTERGTLQLPKTSEYNQLDTNKGLKAIAYEMCRHIGVKPNKLHVQFSSEQSGRDVWYANDTITIHARYRHHPYITGALLAFGVLTYFVERYDDSSPDRAFIEYATIYTGLGIWIVNALGPRAGIRESLYHVIDGSWFNREGLQLESYKADQYAHYVAAYAHDNRIAPETYIKNISARSRQLLPEFTVKKSVLSLPEPEKISHHRKMANLLWVKIIIVALILGVTVTASIYIWSERSPSLNVRQIEDKKAIEIIKQSFDSCIEKASDQQSTYDPNDLFLTRQVDATKSRCESLRNEYNYALDQYTKLYREN